MKGDCERVLLWDNHMPFCKCHLVCKLPCPPEVAARMVAQTNIDVVYLGGLQFLTMCAAVMSVIPQCMFCSGDDDGLIKTWDQRQSDATSSFEVHSDFVSDMVYHEREQCLIAVSGDGTLSVNDLRTNKASLAFLT